MVSLTPNSTKKSEINNVCVSDQCRICMLPGDYFKNSSHELTTRICKMLKTSTQIDVQINDGYPQILCNNCYKQLYESYKFVLLAKSTQKELRKTQPIEKPPNFDPQASTLSPIKENIDFNLNSSLNEQKKQNDLTKLKNSTPNKDPLISTKRQVLRSNIKKEDVIIIENNNSIDLTHSPTEETPPTPIEATLDLPDKKRRLSDKKVSPKPQETLVTLQTPPIEKKRRLLERKSSKTKENDDTASILTATPDILPNSSFETQSIEKKRRTVDRASKTKDEIKIEETSPEIASVVNFLNENDVEVTPVEKKRRILERKVPKTKDELNVSTLNPTASLTPLNLSKILPLNAPKCPILGSNLTKINIASISPSNPTKSPISALVVETPSILNKTPQLEVVSVEKKRRILNKKAPLDVKIDLTETEDSKVDVTALHVEKVNITALSNQKTLPSKNKRKKNVDGLVQTSISSFYMSSPEKSPKKELSPKTRVSIEKEGPVKPPQLRTPNGIEIEEVNVVDLDQKQLIDLTDCDIIPQIPQKVSEKRKRSKDKNSIEINVISTPKNKKIVSKKTVKIVSRKNETKFKTKKGKKTFIKINTKYLTRTFKSKDTKKIVSREEKTPARKLRNGSTESESTPPTFDDILSAVGLIRKKSIDSPDKYECEICHMKFVWTESYRRHLSSKHKLMPYQCRYCDEKFPSAAKLRNHKNQAHEAKMKPYKCKQCEESFKTFDKHLIHVREVHTEKASTVFLCSICKADFDTQDKLDEHFHRHRSIKEEPVEKEEKVEKAKPTKKDKFQCEHCSKIFKKCSDLTRHARVHTGEKPFACNVCNQKFQQRNNLQKHMITVHAEKKAFTCDICTKTFGRQDSMLRHMLTHSIEKPFTCQECKKNFSRQTQLDTHFKRNHSGKNLIDLKTEI